MLYYLVIIVPLIIIIKSIDGEHNHDQFRFVTMNIWSSGGNVYRGIHKIIDHLQRLDADIIALQVIFSYILDSTCVIV